jgi:hypothetical protein
MTDRITWSGLMCTKRTSSLPWPMVGFAARSGITGIANLRPRGLRLARPRRPWRGDLAVLL